MKEYTISTIAITKITKSASSMYLIR